METERKDGFLTKIFNSEVVVVDGEKKLKPGFFKRTAIRAIIAFSIYFGLHFFIADFNGTKMLAFSPDQIRAIHISKNEIVARVIGNHRLETEYGELFIKNFCTIYVTDYLLTTIPSYEFEHGKAEHDFTIDLLTEIPKIVNVWFNDERRISLAFRHSFEINLKDITLSDSTHIVSEHNLLFGTDTGRWSLTTYYPNCFFVKLPDENEYQKYEAVLFERDWGKFVFGRPFTEDSLNNSTLDEMIEAR
ncbi:MAG: hypothetical protein LBH44_05530 [Treponema sp.]|jgi:hypothetical protein|nr:hypothetical protein [Treponema sp.]